LRALLFAVIFICPPILKTYILKWFCSAKIGRRARVGWFSSVMGSHVELGDYCAIRPLTLIRCDGEVRIGAYSEISTFVLVYGAASLSVGDHSYIGPQCLINVEEDVRIGNASGIGPRSMVFTHGSFPPYTEGYFANFRRVTIGDGVWIAAGVIIHPGVEVGNNVVVNAGSVLKQKVPAGELVEGFPARRVTMMDKVTRTMTPARVDAAISEIVGHFSGVVLGRKLGIEFREETTNRIRFHYRRREYVVMCVTSDGVGSSVEEADRDKRLIFVVNRPDWIPPPYVKSPMVLDVTTKRADWSRDRVYVELRRFMRRYYGVWFEHR
jgi:acetyltransferase-like isoleucine patch superfamily enzyme